MSKWPINVLAVSHMYPKPNDPISGIFVHEAYKHIARENYNISILSPIPFVPRLLQNTPKRKAYRKFPHHVILDSIPVYYPKFLTAPGMFFHIISSFTLFLSLNRFINVTIKQFTPALIHSHFATPDGYAAMLLGKRLNIPTICTFRGDDINIYPKESRWVRFLTKKVISETNQIITVSDALRQESLALAKPKTEIMVIHNGCDLKKFSFNPIKRRDLRHRFRINNDHICLIYVGTLDYSKGILELIAAFDTIASSNLKVHLLIVGDGPGREIFEKSRHEVLWGDQLHLPGFVPHDQIPAYMSAGDIFVFPSYNEGFPNVIKEAMACERAVIATQVGGIPEVVHNEKTGLLIAPKDQIALTNAIRWCLSNPEKCKRMGKAGRDLMVQKFSWASFVERHVELYRKLGIPSSGKV